MSDPITFPREDAPETGHAVEIADGVLWMRLPLPMALDHVNVFALDEGTHWSIIDTGFHTKTSVRIWQALLDGPLKGKPVGRVIITHHHPDHVGMAGWFAERDAELLTSRTSFLLSRMLRLDEQERYPDTTKTFYWRNGMAEGFYNKRIQERPFNFADILAPLPVGYTRLSAGETIQIGGRHWRVASGGGHAPEHLTFWSEDDDLVIGGDALLPTISPNIGVYPTEPDGNPLQEWFEACRAYQTIAAPDHFVLTGHKLPYRGLPTRLEQLIDNHVHALDRLRAHLKTPQIGDSCMETIFRRKLNGGEYGMGFVEMIAHLNYLHQAGEVSRELDSQGRYIWQVIR